MPDSISIIMPALNEERNILAAVTSTLEAFGHFGLQGEVIVVNDGSRDRTAEIVGQIMAGDGRIRLITHETPQGIGASFWDGVDVATGEVVAMFPGDNENDPYEALCYFNLLESVDIVIPFVFNKEARSLFRNALSFVYRFIINTTFLVNFNYTNGTVLYRKSILSGLDYRSRGFFFQTDLLVRTAMQGYLFAEVPYRLGMRGSGASKAVSFPSLMKVMRGYIRLVRDVYFSGEGKIRRGFAAGSQTQRRHADNDQRIRK